MELHLLVGRSCSGIHGSGRYRSYLSCRCPSSGKTSTQSTGFYQWAGGYPSCLVYLFRRHGHYLPRSHLCLNRCGEPYFRRNFYQKCGSL